MAEENYRTFLAKDLASRARKNPAFSLRAYSKLLGVSPATLSRVLSGKRSLSAKTAKRLAARAGFESQVQETFLRLVAGLIDSNVPTAEQEIVELDKFRVFSEWYHFGILSLGDMSKNKVSAKWISAQLGISTQTANQALLRLKRLGLIETLPNGSFKTKKNVWVGTQDDDAIRLFHRQALQRAEKTLDQANVRLDLFSTMTLAVDESKLDAARAAIANFRKQIENLVEQGTPRRVYQFSVQLLPLSKENP